MLQVPHTIKPPVKNNYLTLVLLCIGYFLDFYDLTIMGVSYNELLKEQFHILTPTKIQQTYLLISNFQTLGIFIGAILFGMLGDKVGRANTIKYSILVYSLATILAIYTHSLPVFILLRLIAYIGLAAEFSTSTVLIIELMPIKSASWGTAILYTCGVLGGISATCLGSISWKLMFLCGGIGGFLVYLARSKIEESLAYLYARKIHSSKIFGSFLQLLTNRQYIISLLKYLIIILPFNATITMMFIFPSYIATTIPVSSATKILLLGFFIGNIISSFASTFINNYYHNYKTSMYLSLILLISLVINFTNVNEKYLIFYSIGIGTIGGGYPISWAQQIANEYAVHIRSLVTNTLFALGRLSGIIFNLLISSWLSPINVFKENAIYTICIVSILAFICLYSHKNIYRMQLKTP